MNALRSLPSHQDAERALLGSLFLDTRTIPVALDGLSEYDFFNLNHGYIFQAIKELFNDNQNIDYASVGYVLERKHLIEKIGGLKYLISLGNMVPSADHIETYIGHIKEAALKREMINVAQELAEEGLKDIDAKAYIDLAEEKVFAVSQKRKTTAFSEISKVLVEVKEKIEQNKDRTGGITGLNTGFAGLNQMTLGLQPEELIILAARPSMGKSAFAMNLAMNVAKFNKGGKAGVAIFSLEMSNDQLATRMISSESGIENYKIKSGNLSAKEWQFLEASSEAMGRLNVFFDDSAAVSISDIRAKCRKLKQEDKLEFVVIDYLQLIKGDDRINNRQEEVARISRGLKQMARELKIPVLALSQLSRDVEKREDKKPVLADLRESGSIEQDADIVMFLYRDEYYTKSKSNMPGEAEVIIAKNRQGSLGDRKFIFDTEFSRFREHTSHYDDEQ
ncbi:Replicative DNA helicase [Alteracholeplasma palmae J233]|uniref:Replicative DNA helicase n=1 Tax=Alteracholeplasma palmae (strain ATCC 49389 / J233) TaxID=1318466 RepID=U4KQM3_ALTPJ|nr:replicative DNA helicase [Alteracholeplasma palmae]CCV64830.1 Replicative DNA helicase [Alteracholeplasma palmae J233]